MTLIAAASVETVTGTISVDDLGVTLMHEHLYIDLASCYWSAPVDTGPRLVEVAEQPVAMRNLALLQLNPFASRDNLILRDEEEMLKEVEQFASYGGRTIVDVTLPDIGRDVVALRSLAQKSGVNVIAGCGHYVHTSHPPELDSETVEMITDRFLRELLEGIDGTEIRAGLIGEVGTSDPLHPREEKVLRAAARAQVGSGVPLMLHMHPYNTNAHQILTVLESEGMDLRRVVVGHLDCDLGHPYQDQAEILAYHTSIADRGARIQYDCCGNQAYYPASGYFAMGHWLPSDLQRAKAIAQLVEDGYGDRLLLSHDICKKIQLESYGGPGYAHLLRAFPSYLSDLGLDSAVLDSLLRENPRRLFAGAE